MRRAPAILAAAVAWAAGPVDLSARPGADLAPPGAITGAYAAISQAPPSYTYGQLSRWPTDEGTGSTAADAVGGRALSLTGTAWASALIGTGTALDFDGAGHADASSPVPLESRASATVCAWVRPGSDPSATAVVAAVTTSSLGYGRAALSLRPSGVVRATTRDATGDPAGTALSLDTSTGAAPVSATTHLCASWGAGGVRIYAGGALAATGSWSGAFGASSAAWAGVGALKSSASGWTNAVDAAVDGVTWWGRELSAVEIRALYEAGR